MEDANGIEGQEPSLGTYGTPDATATNHPVLSDADRATAHDLACIFGGFCSLLREMDNVSDFAHILRADPEPFSESEIKWLAQTLEEFGWWAASYSDAFSAKSWSGEEDDE